jgi:hypothetical protein
VVWLCAYGQHRSGQTADAFPHFERLRTERRIKPGPEDYKALFAERAMRFVDLVGDDAQALLAEARAAAGQEHVGVVGGEMTVAVLLDAVGAIEETYVVLSVMQITHPRLVTVLAAFYPDASFADWELVDRLPVRVLSSDAGEFGYRILPS